MKLFRSLSSLGACLAAAPAIAWGQQLPPELPGLPTAAPPALVQPQATPPSSQPMLPSQAPALPPPNLAAPPPKEGPPPWASESCLPTTPCFPGMVSVPCPTECCPPRMIVPPMFGGAFPTHSFAATVRAPVQGIATATRTVPIVAVAVSDPVVYFDLSATTQTANVNLNNAQINLLAPYLASSSFRIGENESPQPQNRVFFNYNYLRDVNPSINRNRGSFALVRAQLPGVGPLLQTATANVVARAQNDLIALGLPVSINGRTSTALMQGAPLPTTFIVSNVPAPDPMSPPPVFPFPFVQDLINQIRIFQVGLTTQPNYQSGLAQFAGMVLIPTTFQNSPAALILNQGTAPNYTLNGAGNFQVVAVDGDTVILAAVVRPPRMDVHLGTVGFEKTFLGDMASIGVRVPIYGITNDGGFEDDPIADANVGDLSIVLKFALVSDAASGSTVSAGVVTTAPTGQRAHLAGGGTVHAALLQPFVGALWNTPRFYAHGFSSYVFSTDGRVPDLLLNDFGVGLWLYRAPYSPPRSNAFAAGETPAPVNAFERPGPRNAFADYSAGAPFLTGIAPTVEIHSNTPVEGRGTDIVRAFDTVAITSGVRFMFWDSSSLGVAFGTPLTGPRPYDWNLFAQLNMNY